MAAEHDEAIHPAFPPNSKRKFVQQVYEENGYGPMTLAELRERWQNKFQNMPELLALDVGRDVMPTVKKPWRKQIHFYFDREIGTHGMWRYDPNGLAGNVRNEPRGQLHELREQIANNRAGIITLQGRVQELEEKSATPATSTPSIIVARTTATRTDSDPIPSMGLEGDLFDNLREQQYNASASTSGAPQYQQFPLMMPEGGGFPDIGDSAMGARKPLLKQPPSKKAQRQFEPIWNINSRLQGAILEPADDGGPPTGADTADNRKSKPSLLGAPPPPMGMDVGQSQTAAGPSSAMGIPSLDLLLSVFDQSQQQQQTDYRFQNWLDSGSSGHQQSSQSSIDRRPQPLVNSDPSSTQTQPQSLRSLNLQAPPSNGSGFGSTTMGQVSNNRSRSNDQDSDPLLYGGGGGGEARVLLGGQLYGSGAPTNPKRKWKQGYEAEEALGTTKRWVVSQDEESPPASFPTSSGSGDQDERLLWNRASGGNGRR